MHLKRIFDWLLRKLYPPRCIFCQKVLNDDVRICVCDKCVATVKKIPSEHCAVCGTVIEPGAYVCWICSYEKSPFCSHKSVYYYRDKARRAVINLKFNGKSHYARTMGMLMSVYAPKGREVDCVTFVPMTQRAIKKRGYNQSQLLSEYLAKSIGSESVECLYKQRETKVQSTLKFSERQKNVAGAFKTACEVKGKSILLVDDVYTTGATIRECSKVLKKAGANEIYCITFAMSKGNNNAGQKV